MVNMHKINSIIIAARPNQWMKNLIIFTAIIFSGMLFNIDLFVITFIGFCLFCVLSSTSYILNDIIDYPYDRKHPFKKYRPIASGALSIPDATFIVFLLSLLSLIIALIISVSFFLITFTFLLLHFFYSLYFKKHPVFDIFTISFSFMLRAFAGQALTGYHIQIWLLLTIFFISLFIATAKRHAELIIHGHETRSSLYFYKEHLLDFLTTTFATTTIIAYALYTFLENIQLTHTPFTFYFEEIFPNFEARKWFMITIPLVVYGISRYAQLLYERDQGERPEKIITQDKPLIITILLWALIVISLIYIF
ncbi:MAG TPA: UbiA prenyltransferase family protein [Patescibacteria group bacterium]|nr:UbiA prenyltransferase family protein [Patescibacteria group bacterium]